MAKRKVVGKIVTRSQLIAILRRKGCRVSKSSTNAELVREANRLGLGAKKTDKKTAARKRKLTGKQRATFFRSNPGPDPYSKDMLILDPGGISYTGPFGPFGQYDYSRRSNPGLPSPGQVVGGMGDYTQMNPGMGDYLLEREIAPYESAGSINGLSDYMLLDMTPPAPKKNPRRRRRKAR